MDKFREACIMSNSLWVDSFPLNEEEHVFSKKHERAMKRLIGRMHGGKYHRLSRAAYAALIAAVIIALMICATVMAVQHTNDYVITEYGTYACYNVIYDEDKAPKNPGSLTVGYLPEGYAPYKLNEYPFSYFYIYRHQETEAQLTVSKSTLNGTSQFDTEDYPYEIVEYNGIDYIVYRADENDYGVIWNAGGYCYSVTTTGETKEEAIKIAKSVR